jgi:hypothetical protein
MNARTRGSIQRTPRLREWIDAADTAHNRAQTEIIGNAEIAAAVRDAVADIFDPTYRLLRRVGRRNGPVNQVTE